jgi:predicted RNA-binding protein YlqC (UPF0109 family)
MPTASSIGLESARAPATRYEASSNSKKSPESSRFLGGPLQPGSHLSHAIIPGGTMKELVEAIATALVDHPEGVRVNAVTGGQVTVLELHVHPEDLGKIIGRQGRTAKAIRTLVGAGALKSHKRYSLEIREG